ncbi:MBL fold metallo-hydrolase [Neisseria sp. ZJ106]|uniref:MBL fold metallo-hydrolase n=1 Tax=Neisseria lisongii TaxID=2912188 RepID=A0ABY7RKH1_9NEIS|nr:MBL fold metallo-hydrolase [Neisseria lisongii]MCF7521333.1 MBL fold metallo-hydrolase [Neisseria lisongii]WCL72137.1 MBL fold metallo-hydrolase [Neisseria lisongii]
MKLNKLLFGMALTSMATSAMAFDYQHIRNATAKIHYGNNTFLVDPYLAPKGSYEGFAGTPNSQLRNPLIEMKQPAEEVIKGIDAVIVTHTHDDHWDKKAQEVLPKNIPIFVQNAGDAQLIRSQGFKDVRVMGANTDFNGVKLTRIKGGQHGSDEMYANPQLAELLGDAMGFVMQGKDEKSLYIVGDTVWNEAVEQAVNQFKPDVIVMNTGYAQINGSTDGIIMGKDDVAKMAKFRPQAEIVTVHMDAVNHGAVTSDEMRQFVKQQQLEKQVAVPKEGQVVSFK